MNFILKSKRAQSSWMEFCTGVPVAMKRILVGISRTAFASLVSGFLMRWPSSRKIRSHSAFDRVESKSVGRFERMGMNVFTLEVTMPNVVTTMPLRPRTLSKAYRDSFLFPPHKNMNFIFCKLKKLQKTWISFFCKLKKLQKTWISFFFFKLKKAKKCELNFLKAWKNSKNMNWIIFRALKDSKNMELIFYKLCIHFSLMISLIRMH